MRKLKLQVQISLDGYIAGPNGEMDWLVTEWDEELKSALHEITDPVDCILLGRKLAQGFIPHWASVPNEEGAKKINETPKVVFTKTLDQSEWPNTVLAKGDMVDEVNNLKNKPGSDMIAYGGANFVSSLVKHGLIDELYLLINPTALGKGMPIFEELKTLQQLKLIMSRGFNCGIVLMGYRKA